MIEKFKLVQPELSLEKRRGWGSRGNGREIVKGAQARSSSDVIHSLKPILHATKCACFKVTIL